MMKEIHEQPKAARDTIGHYIVDEAINLSDISTQIAQLDGIEQIYIVACGSAYHVGIAAQYIIEDFAGVPVRVDLASEFRYRKPLLKNRI